VAASPSDHLDDETTQEDPVVTCSAHRRRLRTPVRSPADALSCLSVATEGGRQPALVLACLDRDRRPLTMFVIDGGRAEDLPVALDILLDAVDVQASPLDALVLASSRPGQRAEVDAADLDAWPGLLARCGEAGIILLDWFILADGASASMGDRLGRRPPW